MDVQKYKNLKVKVFFLTLLVIGLIGYIAYDKFLYKYIPIKEDKTNNEVDMSMNIELDEIVVLLKDYYYEKELVKEDNLVSWNITGSEYKGYYGNENNIKYYQLQGSYSCKDKTPTCVYTLSEDETSKKDKHFFEIYASVDESSETKKIKSVERKIPSGDDFKQVNKAVPDNTKKKDILKKVVKSYYTTNKYVDNDNLNTWEITTVQYMKSKGENNLYQMSGSFSCKDNTSNCLHFSSASESVNNVYSFEIIVEIKEKKDVYTIVNIENNIFNDKGMSITKEDLINLLKNYSKNSNLIVEDKLTSWDIATVTYMGYYTKDNNKKYYMLRGTYKCNDNTGTCLTLENIGVKRNDDSYPYLMYMEVSFDSNQKEVVSLTETMPSGNDFISFNENIT